MLLHSSHREDATATWNALCGMSSIIPGTLHLVQTEKKLPLKRYWPRRVGSMQRCEYEIDSDVEFVCQVGALRCAVVGAESTKYQMTSTFGNAALV